MKGTFQSVEEILDHQLSMPFPPVGFELIHALEAHGYVIVESNVLLRAADDSDYCVLCDCHPSHGHDKDCPLNRFLLGGTA